MHWSEAEGPEPLVGAAGDGPNTWFTGVIKYARVYEGGAKAIQNRNHKCH